MEIITSVVELSLVSTKKGIPVKSQFRNYGNICKRSQTH